MEAIEIEEYVPRKKSTPDWIVFHVSLIVGLGSSSVFFLLLNNFTHLSPFTLVKVLGTYIVCSAIFGVVAGRDVGQG